MAPCTDLMCRRVASDVLHDLDSNTPSCKQATLNGSFSMMFTCAHDAVDDDDGSI
jgi:hypothetical protein